MAEWSNALVSKTSKGETSSWVQIPPSPLNMKSATRVRSVLVVVGDFGYGGRQRYTFDLIQGLSARGIQVILVCEGGAFVRRLSKGVRVYTFPMHRGGVEQKRVEKELLRIAKEHAVDLIHAQTKTAMLCCAPASTALQIPLIEHEHHHYAPLAYPLIVAQLRAYADLVITLGPEARKKLIAHGLESARVRTILHGVVLSNFPFADDSTRAAARKRLGLTEEDQVIVYISRIVPGKGLMPLVESFASVAEKLPNAKLLIVGTDATGRIKPAVRKFRRKHGLEGRIRLFPATFDTYRFLAAGDVFCHPVLAKGLSVMEAMAVGLPVVGKSTPHKPFVVDDGETGLLTRPVSSEDRSELAEKLAYILSHPKKARAMGRRAHKKIVTEFSFDAHLDTLLSVYAEMMQKKSAGRTLPHVPTPPVVDDRYLRYA